MKNNYAVLDEPLLDKNDSLYLFYSTAFKTKKESGFLPILFSCGLVNQFHLAQRFIDAVAVIGIRYDIRRFFYVSRGISHRYTGSG